jgi:hypothetical protein
VSAPDLLDRWVGGSEKLVHALFADAEAELAACGGDATKSALHVTVIDEIDAVFRNATHCCRRQWRSYSSICCKSDLGKTGWSQGYPQHSLDWHDKTGESFLMKHC